MSKCSSACFGSYSCNVLCDACAAAFALYSRARCSTELFGDISTWVQMDPQARSRFFQAANRKEREIVRCFRNKSWKSGYQIFVTEFKSNGLGIGELSKKRSRVWGEMPDNRKSDYNNEAAHRKQLIKKYVQKYRRCLKDIFGKKVNKKSDRPLNSFMLFLKDRWTDAKSGDASEKYHMVRKEAVEQWRRDREIRDVYASIYKGSR